VRPSNVVSSHGETWLFDWEYAAQDAPASTDLVAALLNARTDGSRNKIAGDVLDAFLSDVAEAKLTLREAVASLQ
jgi:hypothetical protein